MTEQEQLQNIINILQQELNAGHLNELLTFFTFKGEPNNFVHSLMSVVPNNSLHKLHSETENIGFAFSEKTSSN